MKKQNYRVFWCATSLVLTLTVATAVYMLFGHIFKKDNVINISDFPEESMTSYLNTYAEMSKLNNKENILIVMSMRPLDDTFGAIMVAEAPNHQYFLQYATESERVAAFNKLSNNPEIEVSQNVRREFTNNESEENGTYDSWGIEAIGLNRINEVINEINTEDVEDVTVAVMDSGLNTELFERQYPNKSLETYNIVNNTTDVSDQHGHGTHVTGTIAEGTPNNVKILMIKIDNEGQIYSSDIVAAVDYITYYEKADTINMSFGGESSTSAEYLAIEAAKEKNIITVAAAGNSKTDRPSYPAAFDNTISISAVDSNLEFADAFSNYGDTISFAAPGVNVKSIMSNDTEIAYEDLIRYGDDGDDDHETISGTSMAAPHATSAVAVLKSLNHSISLDDTITLLSNHSMDLGARGWDRLYGYGVIDFSDAAICRDANTSNCDEYGMFKINTPNNIEIAEVTLTPYNYGSLTNILATTISVSTTNGDTITKPLGDFDVDEISISGYDPYESEEQTVTVEYADFSTSFNVTNPINYELGWEYYDGQEIVIKGYKNHNLDIKTLYIPSTIEGYPVKRISYGTFGVYTQEVEDLERGDAYNYVTVVFPETMTYIPGGSFGGNYGFAKLERVISEADELTVGSGVFANLKKLHTVDANILFEVEDYEDMDGNMQHYEATSVFSGDISLSRVSLSEQNTVIPEMVFYGCDSLDSINIPNNVTSIGRSAFSRSGLKNIIGGEGLTTLGDYAFDSTSIESFYLGSSVIEIGEGAFANTYYLTSLTVSEENPKYDSRNNSNSIIETAENKLIVGINTTTIPSSVRTIASNAFLVVQNLYEIEIPEGVTTIEDDAFFNCYLWRVKMPRSLQSVGENAFQGSGNRVLPTVQWVYPDSYALSAAMEHKHSYVIIGESDPAPIGGVLVTFPKNEEANTNTFEAFQTINPENTVILISYYDEENESYSEPVEITEYAVEYQDGLDSLRAASYEEPFLVVLTFDDYEGYHNLRMPVLLLVNKATPTYQIPENLTANPGQALSEITLPEGFSWMDEEGIIEGAGDMTYYAKFTPDDTDNYETVENIPITIYVVTDKTKLEPEFEIEDLIRDDTTPINSSIITVTNMEADNYTISNINIELLSDTADLTFTLRMSDDMFESYYFDGGVQEKEFTATANTIYSSNGYDAPYDDEYHSISFNLDISQCAISYSEDGETYNIDELPTFKEAGSYTVYYTISCENHNPIIGENQVVIRGVIVDSSILRGNNIRITGNLASDLSEKIQFIPSTGSITVSDGNEDPFPIGQDTTLATGNSIEITTNEGNSYTYGIILVGDSTGDGLVDRSDLDAIRQHLMGNSILEGLYLLASDTSDDDQVNSADLLRLKQHLLGTNPIGAI